MMKKSKNNQKKAPTLSEAVRAIYIDFEGFTDRLPSFMGLQIDENFQQIVFDDSLTIAAQAKGLQIAAFEHCMESMIATSVRENRLIAAYSEHELRVIQKYAGLNISDRYLDARKVAKYWFRKCHADHHSPGTGLKDFLRFINYERGAYLGERKSTKRIRAVATMLASKGSYSGLTTTVKAQWTKVLEHNKIDVQGMKSLMSMACKELQLSKEA
jgi:hypothetical protein